MAAKALQLMPCLPVPALDAGRHRMRLELEAFSDAFDLSVVCSRGPSEDPGPMRQFCAERGIALSVVDVPPQPGRVRRWRRTLLATRPYGWEIYSNPALAAAVLAAARGCRPDALVAHHIGHAPAIEEVDGCARMLTAHNVDSVLQRRVAEEQSGKRRFFGLLNARRIAAWERRYLPLFDAVATVSDDDAELLRPHLRPGAVLRTIPTGVDCAALEPGDPSPRASKTVLFLGHLGYAPNIRGAVAFARDVWPRVVAEEPGARLQIVGKDPAEEVRRLAGLEGVELHASVPEVKPYLHGARAMACYLFSGSGARVKLLDAFAARLPVVSTTIGAEGTPVLDGRELLIADSPGEFADATVKLLRDDDLCFRLTGAARSFVVEHGDSRNTGREMVALARELMERGARHP